eukprot:CAMPEP_0198497854 /NCGR_PEP_ID=MMETSP1462-20131121/6648_1 /TAXON_ID=1333877 /ORGANISM="Brandtodinium nutriculum, Strain RCC3387" /LENGTH=46 /DNA_ID= /DNA_START= /DNA_END= /DNA_ORIENTATION=
MFELNAPPAFKGCLVVVARETQWVPEAQGLLHAEFGRRVESLVRRR